jgi:hypothetical protein
VSVVAQLQSSADFPGPTPLNVGGNTATDVTSGGARIHLFLLRARTIDVVVE